MSAFSFSAEDLQANRAGTFSSTQRAAFERQRYRLSLAVAASVVFVVLLLAAGAFALTPLGARYADGLRIVGIGLALSVPVLYTRLRQVQVARDLRGSVAAARGSLRVMRHAGRQTMRYEARVSGASFFLSRDVYKALAAFAREHDECALYYAPFSRAILSFEEA